MNQDQIRELLRRDESQTHERKRSLSLIGAGLENLCAMVNADPAQGNVLFGVAPDGQLVGVEPGDLDKAQLSITQKVRVTFAPPLQVTLGIAEMDGMHFVCLSARRNLDVPYHEYDGRAFIREGTATRQLTLTEKDSLRRRRNRDSHNGPWKCDRCGAWVGMLTSVVITNEGARKTYDCRCGGEYWPA